MLRSQIQNCQSGSGFRNEKMKTSCHSFALYTAKFVHVLRVQKLFRMGSYPLSKKQKKHIVLEGGPSFKTNLLRRKSRRIHSTNVLSVALQHS